MIPSFKKNKKSNQSKILVILGGIFILFIFIVIIIADIKMYEKKEKLNSKIENLKNKIEDIQARNNKLQQGISNVNDQKYIEKVAREELDLQKPGEGVVSFIMPQTQNQENIVKPSNIFQDWMGGLNNSWQWIKDR